MKRLSFGVVCALLCAWVGMAHAQSVPPMVPAQAAVTWTLPTVATDGTPLTGSQAITKVQGFASIAPIPDATSAPTAEIDGAPTKWQYTTTAPNGSTLYFRVRACNIGGCAALSNQATKVIKVEVPGVATGVQVTILVTVSVP